MKRLLTILSYFTVLFFLIACTGPGTEPTASALPETAAPEEIVDVVTVPVTELVVTASDPLPTVGELSAQKLLKTLDLRAHDVDTAYVSSIVAALPDCRVIWNVPLTDGSFSNETDVLTLPNATEADIALLDYFTNLRQVDASGSMAYKALCAFAASHPDTEVRYSLSIGDATLTERDTDFTVPAGTDAASLLESLPYFTSLETVDARGASPDDDVIEQLCALLPKARIRRMIPIGTERFDSASVTLDLRALSDVSADTLIGKLSLFSELKTVATPGNWTEAETARLTSAFPDLTVAGMFSAFGKEFDGASEEIDLSGTKIGDPAEVESFLQKAPFLKKIDMCNCGLSDEQMTALCDAHPDLKVVWIIRIGPHKLRTDAIGFSTKNPSKHTNSNASQEYNDKVKNTKRLFEGDIELLKYCTDLEALDLGHNYLTDNDLKVISGLTKLKILILADNKITDISALTTLKDLEYIELFMNKIPDLSPLAELPNLIDVNVCNIGVTDLSPLFELKSAKRLWYSMNPFDREQAKALKEALPDCLCVYTGRDETGDGWREDPRYQWMRAYFR